MKAKASTCDDRYQQSSDPWGFRTRWYERRKREIVIASLPRPSFESCWELGCSNGELTAALAPRCAELIATDGNERAVAEARTRLAEFPHVTVEHQIHPGDWPAGSFDLIIFSELGYNFSEATLRPMAARLKTSLRADGVLLACHWRYPIEGCDLTGDQAHRILAEVLSFPRLVSHTEADFILEIWSTDGRSVAAREGMA